MKLADVKKENGWLYSEWALTYAVGWEQILRAAALMYRYTSEPQVLTGDACNESQADVKAPEEISSLAEAGYLTLRGSSEVLGVPMMITFYNQLDFVRVWVACATEEFFEADYKKFNLSMCQFLDSAELAMHRGTSA
ncbi:MAG: hypothetical protein IJV00_06785 [Clostridia bacterium]|nr:hypothetical protein [Clostridia bacterium]